VFEQDENGESFEERLRSIARELGRSVERAMDKVDPDEFAETLGVDSSAAREWIDSAGAWLRSQTENLGQEFAGRMSRGPQPSKTADPFRRASAHPLDLPTDEQGLALSALDSGRWTLEPGTQALTAKGEGPGPSDALGIVRELRIRDWIAADGQVTIVGRHALRRWLESESH
jgi:hypothetical protein